MDSLRNLSTSLPRTSPSTNSPHELLSAFKAAALSVTTLYKTAASNQARTRAEGYQQALDELLTFLDRENFGLGVDGEGWRVRQWATERYDGSGLGHSDDDDDKDEPRQESRYPSPEVPRKHEQQEQVAAEASMTVRPQEEAEEEDAEDEVRVEAVSTPVQHSDMFTFRASLPYPSNDHERDMDMDPSTTTSDSSNSVPQTSSTMAVNMFPRQRSNRHGSHRHGGTGNKSTSNAVGNRSTSLNSTNLGNGAGSKRKASDYFDISGFGGFGSSGGFGANPGGKDSDRSASGGKRGRHA